MILIVLRIWGETQTADDIHEDRRYSRVLVRNKQYFYFTSTTVSFIFNTKVKYIPIFVRLYNETESVTKFGNTKERFHFE